MKTVYKFVSTGQNLEAMGGFLHETRLFLFGFVWFVWGFVGSAGVEEEEEVVMMVVVEEEEEVVVVVVVVVEEEDEEVVVWLGVFCCCLA